MTNNMMARMFPIQTEADIYNANARAKAWEQQERIRLEAEEKRRKIDEYITGFTKNYDNITTEGLLSMVNKFVEIDASRDDRARIDRELGDTGEASRYQPAIDEFNKKGHVRALGAIRQGDEYLVDFKNERTGVIGRSKIDGLAREALLEIAETRSPSVKEFENEPVFFDDKGARSMRDIQESDEFKGKKDVKGRTEGKIIFYGKDENGKEVILREPPKKEKGKIGELAREEDELKEEFFKNNPQIDRNEQFNLYAEYRDGRLSPAEASKYGIRVSEELQNEFSDYQKAVEKEAGIKEQAKKSKKQAESEMSKINARAQKIADKIMKMEVDISKAKSKERKVLEKQKQSLIKEMTSLRKQRLELKDLLGN